MHVNREFFVCLSTSSASDVANLQRSAHDTQGQSAQACRPTHDAADGLEFGNAGNSVARCPINASRQRCLRILRARIRKHLWRDAFIGQRATLFRSEEHTTELQSRGHLVCRLLLEKKKKDN